MRRRVVRGAVLAGGSLLGLVVVWLVVASIVYSPTYVGRVLSMRESSQENYLGDFPTRTLAASTRPYVYDEAYDPAVGARLEAAFGVGDIEEFLTSTNSQALLVVQNDVLVYERYAHGAARDTLLTSFSVAKSFDSVLVGAAVDAGLIGVDDSIVEHLPELADDDPRIADITIADLLSMSSGLEYSEMRWALFNGDDPLTTYHPDQRQISLEAATRVQSPPGEYFSYNKYHPQLLGMILERSSGMSVSEYTESRLWKPAGMEFEGQWTLDSDGRGFEKMEAGLNARAIDFAKLGSLMLHKGEWNGSRIVSQEWVGESLARDPERDRPEYYRDDFGQWIHQDGGGWYGYFWYGRARDAAEPDFFAEGDRGQFVYVSPASSTVIVRLGRDFGISSSDWVTGFYEYCTATEAAT